MKKLFGKFSMITLIVYVMITFNSCETKSSLTNFTVDESGENTYLEVRNSNEVNRILTRSDSLNKTKILFITDSQNVLERMVFSLSEDKSEQKIIDVRFTENSNSQGRRQNHFNVINNLNDNRREFQSWKRQYHDIISSSNSNVIIIEEDINNRDERITFEGLESEGVSYFSKSLYCFCKKPLNSVKALCILSVTRCIMDAVCVLSDCDPGDMSNKCQNAREKLALCETAEG